MRPLAGRIRDAAGRFDEPFVEPVDSPVGVPVGPAERPDGGRLADRNAVVKVAVEETDVVGPRARVEGLGTGPCSAIRVIALPEDVRREACRE